MWAHRAYADGEAATLEVRGVPPSSLLTAGTILHNTKTPLTLWFWAAYLMTTDTRGISALVLQRQLGLRRYRDRVDDAP